MTAGLGLPGRHRKPTAEHEANGNPGKRRLPPDEPRLPVGEPEMPDSVRRDEVATAEWHRLVAILLESRVLTPAYGPLLEMTCTAYSDWVRADLALNGELTYTTETESGAKCIKPRPEVAMKADAWRRYSSVLSHFGLTPVTSAKVTAGKAPPTAGADPVGEFEGPRRVG